MTAATGWGTISNAQSSTLKTSTKLYLAVSNPSLEIYAFRSDGFDSSGNQRLDIFVKGMCGLRQLDGLCRYCRDKLQVSCAIAAVSSYDQLFFVPRFRSCLRAQSLVVSCFKMQGMHKIMFELAYLSYIRLAYLSYIRSNWKIFSNVILQEFLQYIVLAMHRSI